MSDFYQKAARYWANVPATIDGVLGGFGHISDIDIKGSRQFLSEILSLDHAPKTSLALDCGAGIGRIAHRLLMPVFDKVDLVEQDEKFIYTAKQTLDSSDKLGTLYNMGLQDFKPEKKYDVIWCQWVLGHLNDYDLISFLERCKRALNKHGVMVIKENITSSQEIEYDDEDSSVTRPYKLMKLIFEETNFTVIKETIQEGFPEDIYTVYSFALTPKKFLGFIY